MSLIVRELVDLGVATANDDGSVGIIFDPAHKQAPIDNADGLDHTET